MTTATLDRTASQTERLLTQDEVANWLQVTTRTLKRWRDEGKGPRHQRVQHLIRYRKSDVESWLNSQR